MTARRQAVTHAIGVKATGAKSHVKRSASTGASGAYVSSSSLVFLVAIQLTRLRQLFYAIALCTATNQLSPASAAACSASPPCQIRLYGIAAVLLLGDADSGGGGMCGIALVLEAVEQADQDAGLAEGQSPEDTAWQHFVTWSALRAASSSPPPLPAATDSSALPDHLRSAAVSSKSTVYCPSVGELSSELARRGPDAQFQTNVVVGGAKLTFVGKCTLTSTQWLCVQFNAACKLNVVVGGAKLTFVSKCTLTSTQWLCVQFMLFATVCCPSGKYVCMQALQCAKLHSASPCSALRLLIQSEDYVRVCCVRSEGAELQLRGLRQVSQPLRDADGNILLFNGEVFGGLSVAPEENDADVLLHALAHCGANNNIAVPSVLSQLRGPWAVIYWQNSTQTVWFGRDAIGRRSLLVHMPTDSDSRFIMTSTAARFNSSITAHVFEYWHDVPTGLHSMDVSVTPRMVREHPWEDSLLQTIRMQVRTAPIEPIDASSEELHAATARFLKVLSEAVCSRVTNIRGGGTLSCLSHDNASVAILFSGGVDSMLLAALAHEHVPITEPIDLGNVCFFGGKSPDRQTARAGLLELQRIAPQRKWRLIEVDMDIDKDVEPCKDKLMALICPSRTFMDFNIAAALWHAASLKGVTMLEDGSRTSFTSKARVVLLGNGADEQCAGYGRHRTKLRETGWQGLQEELAVDVQRLWRRNLGRDDRCVADHGREARFPFLDESVMQFLLSLPLTTVADPRLPSGVGDKRIIRSATKLLGLHHASCLPKRAIQFGTRIAQASNLRNYSSNRAANAANIGGVTLPGLEGARTKA